MKTLEPMLWGLDDHVEHWNHFKPRVNEPCPGGTEHILTFGPDYKLGGICGLMSAMEVCRLRLAELLDLTVGDLFKMHLAFPYDHSGFALILDASSPYGYARVAYHDQTLWTCTFDPDYQLGRSDASLIPLPRRPVSEVMQAAADLIQTNGKGRRP